jgi:hypothetical protein
MTAIPGTKIQSKIVPSDTADTYATHDAIYGVDGWRSVADTTERDAIPSARRRDGMVVYCQSNNTSYQLVNGITNSDWVALGFSTDVVLLSGIQSISGQKTFNDSTVFVGSVSAASTLYIGQSPALIYTGQTTVNTVTNQIVEEFADTLGSGAQWLMNLKNGANIRTSQIMCAWDSGTDALIANEVSTTEVGTTSDVTYSVAIVSNNVRLRVTSVSNGWTLKFHRILL